MKTSYSDERLAMLLAHAQEGRLQHHSCCCFAGIPSVTHSLVAGWCAHPEKDPEYDISVSYAYNRLAYTNGLIENDDEVRRRLIIPMIRAEIKRRDRTGQGQER